MSAPAAQVAASDARGAPRAGDRWMPVCRVSDLDPERGAAALVDGAQVAIFRLHDGSVHAVDHRDPCSGAHVMARGIVGTGTLPDGTTVPTVASPMFKQVFDLRTGECLTGGGVSLGVWNLRVVEGVVLVAMATAT